MVLPHSPHRICSINMNTHLPSSSTHLSSHDIVVAPARDGISSDDTGVSNHPLQPVSDASFSGSITRATLHAAPSAEMPPADDSSDCDGDEAAQLLYRIRGSPTRCRWVITPGTAEPDSTQPLVQHGEGSHTITVHRVSQHVKACRSAECHFTNPPVCRWGAERAATDLCLVAGESCGIRRTLRS